MFEAYKVGVTLSLKNQVSNTLGLIARDFMKTKAEAKALQLELKKIKLLGMGGAILGGAGFMGLYAIKGAVKPAMEYARQLNNMNIAGMKQAEIAESIQNAWKNTSTVITTTATGNLKTILDLRQALGADKGLGEVNKLLPIATQMQAVMAASTNSKLSAHSDELSFGMVKALDIIGAVNNSSELEKQARMMSKVIAATGGRVTPQMFQGVFQYARQSKFDLSDEFKYEILPTLMLEASSSKGGGGGSRGVGPALAAAYRFTNQGYINKKSLPLLESLGLVSAGSALKTTTEGTTVGSMKDAGLAASNFFLWVNQDLVPAIKAKFGEDPRMIRKKINEAMRGNQLAASLAVEFYTKQSNFLRDQKINRAALPYDDAYISLLANDPKTSYEALGMQWENLKTALGITIIPVLIPFLRNLTAAFNSLAVFAHRHPTLAQGLVVTFTALSSLATLGGGLMLAAAAIKMIVGPMKLLLTPLQLMGTIPLAGIASGIGLIAGSLAALAGIVYHKEIANWIDNKAPQIGDYLYNWAHPHDKDGSVRGAPPSGGKPMQVQTQVNLDGRQIAKVVSDHFTYNMNGESKSGSSFDFRQGYIPSSFTP